MGGKERRGERGKEGGAHGLRNVRGCHSYLCCRCFLVNWEFGRKYFLGLLSGTVRSEGVEG